MCFSAGASFTAGVLLTFAGVETLRKVHKPSQIVFACIPLFFAFQQFVEGTLWVIITRQGFSVMQSVSTYTFLLMAQVIWPLMVPFSVLFMEKNKTRKKILLALLGIGAAVAIYYLYSLLFFPPTAQISRWHMAYHSNFADPLGAVAGVCYLITTIVPLLISSIKRTWILGVIIGLAFAVSAIFYIKCLTSVWCFFAAVISFAVYYIVRDEHKKFHLAKIKLADVIDVISLKKEIP